MNMPVQPTDIALFLVSFAACIYCVVLSRRLKQLQNTRNGLGASIKAMSDSVTAVSAATHETLNQAAGVATRLSALLTEANQACDRVAELTEQLDGAHTQTVRSMRAAQSEIRDSISQSLTQSRERLAEMQALMKRMEALRDAAPSSFGSTDFLFEEEERSTSGRSY